MSDTLNDSQPHQEEMQSDFFTEGAGVNDPDSPSSDPTNDLKSETFAENNPKALASPTDNQLNLPGVKSGNMEPITGANETYKSKEEASSADPIHPTTSSQTNLAPPPDQILSAPTEENDEIQAAKDEEEIPKEKEAEILANNFTNPERLIEELNLIKEEVNKPGGKA